ncbi:hypothetical protein FRB99_002918, partial [Tulasnella sp. 403]
MQSLGAEIRKAATPTTLMPALRLYHDCLVQFSDQQEVESIKHELCKEFLSPYSTEILLEDLSIDPGSLE